MASLDNLTVTFSESDTNTVVAEGQIDSHTSALLDEALAELNADDEIAIDLSQVTFIDSSGLRVLVRAHKRREGDGGQLAIVRPSDPVCRLFDITGLTSELSISQ